MSPSHLTLDQVFEAHLQTLALTLRPGSVYAYRGAVKQFLCYLHTAFPQLQHPQLRRGSPCARLVPFSL